ncbi:hypothetical protein X275_00645 [Marinitoga sp. 1197]|uniref:GNAT family N-acetyltransferase n=1 Tax=Marinitoga sp. 1197 TaxID=1428449 RepID=UPI0006415001|nr:GNAT family N-acetyltransferase [Marinitoga sp. 1197]KLO24339.1 hypothetical protein X275_00645 [Marinitoga sp. 1197]
MNNKEKYIQFCEKEKIPIFSQYWWLDAVCGRENWDVALFESGGEIWGSLPYYKKKKYTLTLLTMPKLTQKLGPYIKYPKKQSYYKKISWEKKVMIELIKQLPKFDFYSQNWDYNYQNWLPFYWNGFKQTTRYTYVIEKNNTLQEIEKNFHSDIRRRMKKVKEQGIKIIETDDYKTFYKINKMTFERKKQKISYTLNLVEKIYIKSKERNSVKILFAKDKNNEIHAAGFFVYDKDSVYYLMGGINPEKKDTGAMNLIIYEGIKFAIKNNLNFDFEGSMIESIEKYFRSFGAVQKMYFNVYKVNNLILKLFF